MKQQSLAVTYNKRRVIDLAPFFQVASCRWKLSQKQLFIDSLINGYDTPKIYLHDTSDIPWANNGFTYSLIDGKQRLKESLFAFMDDSFSLAPDFKYGEDSVGYGLLDEKDFPVAGMKYSQMSNNFKDYFKDITLDFVEIQTRSIQKVMRLFTRLQNGTTLNRMEIRNSFNSQTYLDLARRLTTHTLFRDYAKFPTARMKHLEAACRILQLDHVEASYGFDVCDLGATELDKLVNDNKNIDSLAIKKVEARVEKDLNNFVHVCSSVDLHIRAMNINTYFVFIKRVLNSYTSKSNDRFLVLGMFIEGFEKLYTEYRHIEGPHQVDLEKYKAATMQHTAHASNLKDRVQILYDRFIVQYGKVMLELDDTRNFSPEIREYIWRHNNKKCQVCDIPLSLEEMDADHKEPWYRGGQTTLSNSRCLCVSCNRSRKAA